LVSLPTLSSYTPFYTKPTGNVSPAAWNNAGLRPAPIAPPASGALNVGPTAATVNIPYYLYANSSTQYQDALHYLNRASNPATYVLGSEFAEQQQSCGLVQLTNALRNDLTLLKRDNVQIKEELAQLKRHFNIVG
jgi:hypothetical protein